MAQNAPRQRALGAIVKNALFRWESIVTIAMTVILYLFFKEPFPWWQDWFWLVGGAIAEGALLASAVADPDAAAEAVAREFENKFELGRIRNAVARQRLERAMQYRRDMMILVRRHAGAMRTQLLQTVKDTESWIEQMYSLAQHIDDFESNRLVEEDRRRVPQQIDATKVRIEHENDPTVRRDLENQLKRLEQQQANLEATVNSIRRAEIQLESTLSSLGTIYAQMSLLGTKEVDSSRAQRLRLEIQDEVGQLQDTIEAMDEVQAQALRLQ
jgi:hypothetical protein